MALALYFGACAGPLRHISQPLPQPLSHLHPVHFESCSDQVLHVCTCPWSRKDWLTKTFFPTSSHRCQQALDLCKTMKSSFWRLEVQHNIPLHRATRKQWHVIALRSLSHYEQWLGLTSCASRGLLAWLLWKITSNSTLCNHLHSWGQSHHFPRMFTDVPIYPVWITWGQTLYTFTVHRTWFSKMNGQYGDAASWLLADT